MQIPKRADAAQCHNENRHEHRGKKIALTTMERSVTGVENRRRENELPGSAAPR